MHGRTEVQQSLVNNICWSLELCAVYRLCAIWRHHRTPHLKRHYVNPSCGGSHLCMMARVILGKICDLGHAHRANQENQYNNVHTSCSLCLTLSYYNPLCLNSSLCSWYNCCRNVDKRWISVVGPPTKMCLQAMATFEVRHQVGTS
jgi:hypothetical protein